MSGSEAVGQPPTGFGYSYWFTCTECDGRVEVDADLFELQCTGQADYSVCACGTCFSMARPSSPLCRDHPGLGVRRLATRC